MKRQHQRQVRLCSMVQLAVVVCCLLVGLGEQQGAAGKAWDGCLSSCGAAYDAIKQ
jgi:hypothetical protein